MQLNIWKINDTNYEDALIKSIEKTISYSSKTHLLDYKKYKYSLLEKYVYDISMFHFNRLNIEYNSDTHYIEFWCKNTIELNNFHFDCDE